MCGSALSMVVFAACGQVFTAVTRRVLLRKSMTTGQVAGVGLVVLGLVVRSAGKAWAALTVAPAPVAAAAGAAGAAVAPAELDLAAGAGLIMLSALGYSLLGCLYEWLSALRGAAMSHTAVGGWVCAVAV
ncbi:hypothetical protein GPECTOR_7g1097 [Gonium pectorale]|uniref:EamA domain-containing protein n=1 Tax=Gonium pectorale TaxID=33097 RepID=A0A150GTU1_GONPE|nr:hypothetical protein GPECTOR_7g1097 [Gonium pectorale]|eukprot:KXZ53204.1 hypothetical protein GPECTOR_7g1097 [Gonium pectorale]